MRRKSEQEQHFDAETSWPDTPKGDEMTVIGPGARIEGNLVSTASLRIEGRIKGQVTAEGDVIVAPQAEVDSDIRATNISIAGRYAGNLTAAGTLELAATARVEGNISCRSLIVNQGAVFTGQTSMDDSAADLERVSVESPAPDEE